MKSTLQFPAWQPIKTVPKGGVDGVPAFDLWVDRGYRNKRLTDCFWDNSEHQFVRRVHYLMDDRRRCTRYEPVKNPSHWMPLPEAPE